MKAILLERFVLMGKKSMISHYMKLHYCLELFSKIQDHSFFNVDTTSELAFGLENRGMEETQILKKVDKTVQELQIGETDESKHF